MSLLPELAIGLLAGATLVVCGAEAAKGPEPPTRRALIIGVNQYVSDQIFDLRGAVNDVESMREVLTTRFGFPEANVVVLTDEQAYFFIK